jgi:sRNA-binding carbon storage regulator CsrA
MEEELKSGLVLTRKPGQKILVVVGEEEVWITVDWIDMRKVALRFNASEKVGIFREELLEGSDDDAE